MVEELEIRDEMFESNEEKSLTMIKEDATAAKVIDHDDIHIGGEEIQLITAL